MIGTGRNLWIETRLVLGILVMCYVVGVACAFQRSTISDSFSVALKEESGRASAAVDAYYGQMWFRTWQAPLMMALKWIATFTFLMFTFGTTAIQGAAHYYKHENEQSHVPTVINGYVESYGTPAITSFWG
ncbi:uncharacterized protein LOC109423268 [Aedes albopictus]|uniref:Secreted protein n=1 Tax=Aedes albopictus TaxID=7160 RepID=A0ABM2A784_AEDAL